MTPRARSPRVHAGGATAARTSTAAGRARALLAVITLAVGIGSCQLPQPRIPRLFVGATSGGTGDGGSAAAPRLETREPSRPG